MKKWLIIIILVLLILIPITFFRYVSFSKVEGKVIDGDGNPIENAEVRVSYLCNRLVFDPGGGSHPANFGYRETKTDISGDFNFNSLNKGFVFNFPLVLSCKKYITVDKEGYCNERFYNENIKEPCWINYGGASAFISSSEKVIEFKLNKVESYSPSDVVCKIFKEDCKKSFSFKEAVLSQNLLKCAEGCQYIDDNGVNQFKENCDIFSTYFNSISYVYECNTEIALAKKDASICNEIYFTRENNDVFSNLRASSNNPEYDTKEFKRRCFEILAKELKDISLCDNPVFNEFDEEKHHYKNSCKFEVIKELRDISKCELLEGTSSSIFTSESGPSLKEECKIFLS